MLRVIFNILWLFMAGLELFFLYIAAGIAGCIFIVTIPVAVACFRMAWYILWPFGRKVVPKPGAGAGSALMNAVWFLVAGLWLAIGHIGTAFVQMLTIVGIPVAIANIKLFPISCFPFGKQIVPNESAEVTVQTPLT